MSGRRRPTRAHLLAALLLGALGFTLVVQVRSQQEDRYEGLDQSQLVNVLDDVENRSERLDAEARDLQATQDELKSGSDRAAAAQRAARSRLSVLGILAGTVPATGPGVRLTVADPRGQVTAAVLLDTVEELRDAGAEALQVGPVRIVASTSFTDAGTGAVRVDGQTLTPPYTFLAVGDAETMAAALDIPGGVLETLRRGGATGTVQRAGGLTVPATRPAATPRYATPGPAG
jgi:uncharacterized protein YlxW (UPF0749 family)